MRHPFFWTAREAWFLRQPAPNGRTKTIRLSDDRDEAFRIWEADYRPKRATPVKPMPVKSLPVTVVAGNVDEPAREVNQSLTTNSTTSEPRTTGSRKRDEFAPPPVDRLAQLERVLLVAELLSPLRRGATAGELASDVRDIIGRQFSQRTIDRDCQLLQRLGIVDRVGQCSGGMSRDPSRYRWRDASIRSVIVQRMSESASSFRGDDR